MKAKVNNNVNQSVNNLSLYAGESISKIIQMARFCKENQEATPAYDMVKFDISQENYDRISAILRLAGNEDIPVSAYFEAVVLDFLMTHDDDGIKLFIEEIIKRRK